MFYFFFSLMESQSGHHPGHHGHSAPHNSTLPHQIHSGGGRTPHEINLDSSHPHSHHHQQQSPHQSKQKSDPHQSRETKNQTTHHHRHHHVSRIFFHLLVLKAL